MNDKSEKNLTLITDSSITSKTATITDFTTNTSNRAEAPELAKHKCEYPTPPPPNPGRFRYSLFVITTYIGFGNCCFFCCSPFLALENIFRGMGYRTPKSFICAALNIPPAICCMCPCILARLRKKFRKKRRIKGSCLVDCFLSCTLFCCVAAQLLTEARGVIIDRKRGTNEDEDDE